MEKYYTENNYSDIAIALEDYTYGKNGKFFIPSLTPFLNSNSVSENNEKNKYNNIMNKDKVKLQISQTNTCNYINLFIPLELYKGSNAEKDYKGNKGDKFIILFVGGDINDCKIIGRYY